MTARYGLLGRSLGHSWSPQIHKALAGYDYELFCVEPDDLADFLRDTPCLGLNVTIPYKKSVIPFCASLSARAERLGSVNTMVRRAGGWYGDNTDCLGFRAMLAQFDVSGAKALVLGSGGAGIMAAQTLKDMGAEAEIVSRSGPVNYENMDRDADLIVNATPVGMWPENGLCPVELREFPRCRGVADLIYNPLRTRLLLDADELNIPAVSGLKMLVVQAKYAAELFTGVEIPDEKAEAVRKTLQQRMENLVLIGMPGCGKTAVGRLLAERLGRPFYDADALLVERYGDIPTIFAEQGEAAFREMETEILAELGKNSGAVVATGGGCVTRPENRPLLRQNGRLIWLRRPLAELPTEGRPLSQSTALTAMYAQREPLYRAWAQHTVDNTGTPEAAVQAILAQL